MSDEAPTLLMTCKRFRRYESGDFAVEDAPREGRPKSATDDENVAAIGDDGRVGLEKLQETLGIDATSNWRVLTKGLSLKFSKLCGLPPAQA